MVEQQNRSLLRAMRASQVEGKDWRLELNKSSSTGLPIHNRGVSPGKLFLQQETNYQATRVSTEGGKSQMDMTLQKVRDRDSEKKQLAKHYAEMRYHSKDRPIAVGDVVLFERKRENKLSPSYESQPYEVAARYGDQVVLKSPQGIDYKRNLQHIKTWRYETCGGCRMQY